MKFMLDSAALQVSLSFNGEVGQERRRIFHRFRLVVFLNIWEIYTTS